MAKTDNLTDFLTNTADAIRTAEGSTDAINPQDFEAKITALKLSVQTADANATAADILSGKTAWVNGTKISGSIGTKAATTIVPGTLDQTIASGVYLSGAQTIKGDANLIADNIRSGTSIFGVTGTYEGSGGGYKLKKVSFTLSSNKALTQYTINHNCGTIPKFVMVSSNSENSAYLCSGCAENTQQAASFTFKSGPSTYTAAVTSKTFIFKSTGSMTIRYLSGKKYTFYFFY